MGSIGKTKKSIHATRHYVMQLSLLITSLGCHTGTQSRDKQVNSDEPGATVEVSGTTSNDTATDFKQAGESVQVGGTNLADATHTLVIYSVSANGEEEYQRMTFEGAKFSATISADKYYRFEVSDLKLSSVVAPNFATTTASAFLKLDNTSTIAAKILSVIASKAKSGDENSAKVLNQWTLGVMDLMMLGASVNRALTQTTGTKPTISISNLAANLASETVTKTATLASSGTSALSYAKTIAQEQYSTFYKQTDSYSPAVAAYTTKQLGDDASQKAAISLFKTDGVGAPGVANAAQSLHYRTATDPYSSTTETSITTTYTANQNSDPSSMTFAKASQATPVETSTTSTTGTTTPTTVPTATTTPTTSVSPTPTTTPTPSTTTIP
jgi:hypothetical protein